MLVNNASLFEYDNVGELRRAMRWSGTGAINTAAPVLLARALHAHLTRREARGCAVNLLDQKLWNPNPDYFSYTLSKAALTRRRRCSRIALAPRLRVCRRRARRDPAVGRDERGAVRRRRTALTPLGRSSTPADIARAVRFLVEAPAITGTTLLVDGGQHLAAQPRDVLFLCASG